MLIKRLSVLAVATSLVACASTTAQKAETVAPAPATRVVEVAPQVVPVHPYAMPTRQARVVPQAPEWFVRMPEDTAEMTFAVGTATSTDEQMAYDKARMAAERKLVEQMYARITTQTNSFKADRGSATIENYQQVTRKNARGELSGAQRVDSQVTHDGQNYKVYVLLRLPTGAATAERDMDASETRDARIEQENTRSLERSLEPQSRVTPVTVPETVKTTQGEIKLLDVDNAEYRQKRAEALAKPNAVVGQTTLR